MQPLTLLHACPHRFTPPLTNTPLHVTPHHPSTVVPGAWQLMCPRRFKHHKTRLFVSILVLKQVCIHEYRINPW